MKTLNTSDIKNIEFDLENGFVWAEGESKNSNLFQACLVQRKDGNGYKKELKQSDNGYTEGVCGDYNDSLGYRDLNECNCVFVKACRKAGFKII